MPEVLERLKSLLDEEDVHPPASKTTVKATEDVLGFRLPHLLRQFYMQVSNGSGGPPGSSVIGLDGGLSLFGDGQWLAEIYKDFLGFDEDPWWFNGSVFSAWPPKLVPFCSWSDLTYSCFYRNDENNPDDVSVYTSDMNGFLETAPEPYKTLVISKYLHSLEEWFELWISEADMYEHKHKAYRSNLSRIRYNQNEKWSRIPESKS